MGGEHWLAAFNHGATVALKAFVVSLSEMPKRMRIKKFASRLIRSLSHG